MSRGTQLITLNGAAVWADVVETADGVRVQLALDDWLRLNLDNRRIPVRLPDRDDVWLFTATVTELPADRVDDDGEADEGGGVTSLGLWT